MFPQKIFRRTKTKSKTRRRESLPLRYLVNGRPGSRTSSSVAAALAESTTQDNIELMGRLLPAANEEMNDDLNLSNDNDDIGDKGTEHRRIHNAEVFVDLRGRK